MDAFIEPPAHVPFYLRFALWIVRRRTGVDLLPPRLLAWYPKAGRRSCPKRNWPPSKGTLRWGTLYPYRLDDVIAHETYSTARSSPRTARHVVVSIASWRAQGNRLATVVRLN